MKSLKFALIAACVAVFCHSAYAQSNSNDPMLGAKAADGVERVYTLDEVVAKPTYPGGEVAMQAFIDSSFIGCSDMGAALANVVINADGSISDIKISRSSDTTFCEKAKRVVASMPTWLPAKIDNVPVRVSYAIPVIFCPRPTNDVEYDGEGVGSSTKQVVKDVGTTGGKLEQDVVCQLSGVDEKPEFPGGQEGMYRYLGASVHYPEINPEVDIQGTVVAQFIIDKDGNPSDVKALRSPSRDFTREVMRVVLMMPKWTPGKKDGQPVRVGYILPVKFKLTE